jgi:hypothetical protein
MIIVPVELDWNSGTPVSGHLGFVTRHTKGQQADLMPQNCLDLNKIKLEKSYLLADDIHP